MHIRSSHLITYTNILKLTFILEYGHECGGMGRGGKSTTPDHGRFRSYSGRFIRLAELNLLSLPTLAKFLLGWINNIDVLLYMMLYITRVRKLAIFLFMQTQCDIIKKQKSE